ncbi:MAG: hypothetical protein V4592_23300 [Bacteroidota bacterium]
MSTSQNQSKSTEKKTDQLEELKTEGPLSEKDEVKAAERKMAKRIKTAAQTKK